MRKLLVVDDEPGIRFSVERVLASAQLTVLTASNAAEARQIHAEAKPDVTLLDIRLGKDSGLELLSDLRRADPRTVIILITGHGTADTAIEAMKLGAYDYLLKPLDADHLRQVVDQALKISRLMHVPATMDEAPSAELLPDRLVGSSPAMQAVCKKIGRLAPQDVSVLILGESGTGKELVARAIYHHSARNAAPFVAINCAAIPESLLESELFGHEKGAFTGADRRRLGKFEQCNGGTLFLDEVGDMSPHTQAKILRLLQEGRLERIGGNESIDVNVRIIAATNQDLTRLIKEERFRTDLYYRLRGATITLPPLRERRDDIPELAHHFLFRHNRLLNTAAQSISQEAMEILCAHDWPGNVRELQNVVREALIVSIGPTILPEFIPPELHLKHGDTDPEGDIEAMPDLGEAGLLPTMIERYLADGEGDVYRRVRDHFDALVISRALKASGGSQRRAAELLGLSRITLREKLRALKRAATPA